MAYDADIYDYTPSMSHQCSDDELRVMAVHHRSLKPEGVSQRIQSFRHAAGRSLPPPGAACSRKTASFILNPNKRLPARSATLDTFPNDDVIIRSPQPTEHLGIAKLRPRGRWRASLWIILAVHAILTCLEIFAMVSPCPCTESVDDDDNYGPGSRITALLSDSGNPPRVYDDAASQSQLFCGSPVPVVSSSHQSMPLGDSSLLGREGAIHVTDKDHLMLPKSHRADDVLLFCPLPADWNRKNKLPFHRHQPDEACTSSCHDKLGEKAAKLKVAIQMLFGLGLYMVQLWHVSHASLLQVLNYGLPWPSSATRRSGAWTPSTSPEMLIESCRIIRLECGITLAFAVATLVPLAIARSYLVLGISHDAASFVDMACGPGSSMCRAAFFSIRPLNFLNGGTCQMMVLLMATTPIELWSPVVRRGLRLLGSAAFGARVLVLMPWMLLPASATAIYLAVKFTVALPEYTPGLSRSGILCYVGTGLMVLVYFMVIWLLLLLPESWMAKRARPATVHVAPARRRSSLLVKPYMLSESCKSGAPRLPADVTERNLQQSHSKSRSARRDAVSVALSGVFSWLWEIVADAIHCEEGSLQQRRCMFVFLSHFAWMMPSGPNASLAAMAWAMRLVGAAAIVCTRDIPLDHSGLKEHHDPGFGLVVNSAHLIRALKAALGDAPPYDGPLHSYKGTIWRMQDTVAVSYRWQSGHSFPISTAKNSCMIPPLNMRPWQMASLANALEASTARYVWIDFLSVPQKDCRLQRTLLARMLPVYAAAGAGTVVLRSCEPDGHRYHQRGWTFQEFCASGKLCTYTEEADGGDQHQDSHEQGISRTVEEEELMLSFRWSHISRIDECVPYWISKHDDDDARFGCPAKLRAIAKKYIFLSSTVNCTVEEDKLRALFPLVMNTPVEDQAQAVEVAERVFRSANVDLPACLRKLIDSSVE